MSSTSLPPLPALIPIAVLRKSPPNNNTNNTGGDEQQHHHHPKVNVEQRPSRPPGELVDVPTIDTARSRGSSAAPQSRNIRPERHRKSDRRRRDRRRRAKTRSESKGPEPEPINPRVNPIFVWVRQEDTRIVEVKCEDYDRRNRILLTKTPQGWRATPRTETAGSHLKEGDDKKHQHHHHHRSKKSKKNKTKQKSTAVQVGDFSDENQEEHNEEVSPPEEPSETFPDWESPVNVESLLPSHTIHVHRKDSRSEQSSPVGSPSCVNSDVVEESAQIQNKCSADKVCDISPLDNLLAVAELEFNQQIQSGEWNTENSDIHQGDNEEIESVPLINQDEDQKDFLDEMQQLESLIESCSQNKLTAGEHFSSKEDCDYTEDEENNIAMNDILNRLEQSLRSPESSEILPEKVPAPEEHPDDTDQFESKENCDDFTVTDSFVDETLKDLVSENSDKLMEEHLEDLMSTEEVKQDQPTDLSFKSAKNDLTIEIPPPRNDYFEQPTDLSIPKSSKYSPVSANLTPRPPSQSSEALQSPQPSGLPAVPPSPDIVSPGSLSMKGKTTFLESLLANSSPKMPLNQELTIKGQETPLDLGKCRKSPSPTVTCSEEVQNKHVEGEPPSKKLKRLESNPQNNLPDTDIPPKRNEEVSQRPTKDTEELLLSPVEQFQRLLRDKTLNVPDPMLVPKKYLRKIIANPGKEIPELLRLRPELRLPEALEFSHLLQDPDILVITIQQLEKIIKQQTETIEKYTKATFKPEKNDKIAEKQSIKSNEKESTKKIATNKTEETTKNSESGRTQDHSDRESASNAALNQMLWLPYMNQYENLQFGGNPDLMMMLANTNMTRTMPAHPPDLSHLMLNNGFSGNFRIPPYNNPLEMQMWQNAIIQSGLLGQKDNYDMRNSFKDLMERMNYEDLNRKYMHNQKYSMENKYAMHNQFFQTPMSNMSNPFMNHPQTCQVNMKSTMPTPAQFNASLQKNMADHTNWQKHHSRNSSHRSTQEKNLHQGTIRMKPAYKLMNNIQSAKASTHEHLGHTKEKYTDGQTRHQAGQPIDLSGASPTVGVKSKVRQQHSLIDSFSHGVKHSRNEDVGEVGSTTASIEEMQEAHKHLWHPLFGNEKCHNNPWNWSSSVSTSSE